MTSEINNMFNQSSCLTIGEIEQYVSGTLSEKDIRRVELHLADCTMCSDELDGYLLLKDKNNLQNIVSDLNNQIDQRILASKLIPLHSSRTVIRKRIFSIAASLILLIGAGFIINFYLNNSNNNLAEAPSIEKQLNEDTGTLKPVTEKSVKVDNTKPDNLQKSSEIDDTKSVNTVSSESSNNIHPNSGIVKENDKNIISVTGNNEENEESVNEDHTFDDEAVDETNVDEIVISTEKKSENKDVVISGLEKNMNAKSESEKPKEEISFRTTRGGSDLKNKKTARKKEIEKYTSLRESALLSYNMKIWDEALKDFETYLAYKPNDFEIVYKSGVSNYNLKKYSKAVILFDKVVKEGINRYVEDAEWYKAKSLIKLGKNTEAKVVLNKIIVKNGKYQNQALDLLNTLN